MTFSRPHPSIRIRPVPAPGPCPRSCPSRCLPLVLPHAGPLTSKGRNPPTCRQTQPARPHPSCVSFNRAMGLAGGTSALPCQQQRIRPAYVAPRAHTIPSTVSRPFIRLTSPVHAPGTPSQPRSMSWLTASTTAPCVCLCRVLVQTPCTYRFVKLMHPYQNAACDIPTRLRAPRHRVSRPPAHHCAFDTAAACGLRDRP